MSTEVPVPETGEFDATVYAEALISTVARAFYDDTCIALIDVLIRDKFLRDDQDMGMRLSLPPKQLRKTLQFLQDEHLVKAEAVNDLAEGGSQATRFFYIDYNHAVKSIRLRIFLLRKKLEDAEKRARHSSVYICPGYKTKTCNGRYTETEAQQVVDPETGLFLCQECMNAHVANPDPPPKETYTLQLVDNTKSLKEAIDNIRRVDVQFKSKTVGNQQMRQGIYDLIQKIKAKGSVPLVSNLPSENRLMNIGSTRIEGTGRTAGNKIKKLKEKMSEHGGDIKKIRLTSGQDDLTFLKNALGQQIALKVEKGAGSRAHHLAKGVSREKLLDSAAIRVGAELDLITSLAVRHKRKREAEEEENRDEESQLKKSKNATLLFLRNNIGRNDQEQLHNYAEEENPDDSDDDEVMLVNDSDDEWAEMKEDERLAIFQALYKKEKARLLGGEAGASNDVDDADIPGVNWEDA